MDLSDKGNEIIFFMDRSRKVTRIPASVHAQIEVPDENRIEQLVSSRTIIGRGQAADLFIKDKKISEEHAAIGYFDGIFFILDLKSKNGTYVNGERVRERVLKDNDEIMLGQKTIIFNVSGRLHEEASERWPTGQMSIARILEMISGKIESGKFEDPTRIVIEGKDKLSSKAPLTQIYLEVVSGPDAGKRFNFLQKEIVIGRTRGDLVLKDPDVSKAHAEIDTYDKGQIFIRDTGSTNGTFVNDNKTDRMQLKSGDIITVGSTELEITFGDVLAHPYVKGQKFDEKTTRRNYKKSAYVLEIISGNEKGKKINLEVGEHIVGRNIEGISLKDMDVSRNHARIAITDMGKIFIADMQSTNGTFVNGKKIEEIELKKGDEIMVGNTTMKIS